MTQEQRRTEPPVERDLALRQSLLETAFFAATRAGSGLIEQRSSIAQIDTKSTENDWVSEADRAAERLISASIRATRPDDGQIGEEGTSESGTTGLTWNFDPLDGTVNYLYGSNTWCVSVACADEEGTLIGVVHEPMANKTYWAIRGGGAFLNGSVLNVRDSVLLSRSLVSIGYAYDTDTRARQADLIAQVLPRVRDVRRNGSAALSLCHVGSGEVDAYFESPINLWDISAASLIAAEAGAIASIGETPRGLSVMVAAPGIHEEFSDLVISLDERREFFPHLAAIPRPTGTAERTPSIHTAGGNQ